MIEKVFKCDLCHSIVDGGDEPEPWQIKWMGGFHHLKLLPLHHSEASEDIICGKCLAALQRPFKDQPTQEKCHE